MAAKLHRPDDPLDDLQGLCLLVIQMRSAAAQAAPVNFGPKYGQVIMALENRALELLGAKGGNETP